MPTGHQGPLFGRHRAVLPSLSPTGGFTVDITEITQQFPLIVAVVRFSALSVLASSPGH